MRQFCLHLEIDLNQTNRFMILHRKNETGYYFKFIFLCHLFICSDSIFAQQLIENDTSFYVVNDLQFSKIDT